MFKPLYCVEVHREFRDDDLVKHYSFKDAPTREQIIERLIEDGLSDDPDTWDLKWYPIGGTL